MKNIIKNSFFRKVSVLAVLLLPFNVGVSYAGDNQFKFRTQLKTQYISEDHSDLGTKENDPQSDFIFDAKTNITYRANEYFTAGTELRALKSFGVVSFQDDEGNTSTDESYFEVRQLWGKFTNLFGNPYYDATFGRQRMREDRANMWNRDFDAVRLSYNSTLLNGFIAAGQNMGSYRTETDSDFQEDDEKRFRLLGQTRWQWSLDHFIEVRALYENDHSGLEGIGSLIRSDDRDLVDNNLLWTSLRITGISPVDEKYIINRIKYRFDLMGLHGETKSIGTSSALDAKFRSVSSRSSRDVSAWAFDGGLEFEFDTKSKTTLMVNYAYASGDDNPNGTDNSFRQNGLHGNSSYGLNSYGTIKNYGEVFRPELTNMHILSAGLNVHIFDASDINILYHHYRREEDNAAIGSSGINASLVNNDAYLGQGLDFVSHINVGKEFDFENKIANNSMLKFSAGVFEAGDAYGPAKGERAFRGLIELRIKL